MNAQGHLAQQSERLRSFSDFIIPKKTTINLCMCIEIDYIIHLKIIVHYLTSAFFSQ